MTLSWDRRIWRKPRCQRAVTAHHSSHRPLGPSDCGRPQNDPQRVASSHRLDKPLKIGQETRVLSFFGLAFTAAFRNAFRPSRMFIANVGNASVNCRARQYRNPRHQTDAATIKRQSFRCRKVSSVTQVQRQTLTRGRRVRGRPAPGSATFLAGRATADLSV